MFLQFPSRTQALGAAWKSSTNNTLSHTSLSLLFFGKRAYIISSERYGERVDEIQTKRIDPKNPWLRSVSECVIVRYTAFTFSSPPKQDILQKTQNLQHQPNLVAFPPEIAIKKSVRQGMARGTIVKICLSCLCIPLSFFSPFSIE
jgi:hypothetical protein